MREGMGNSDRGGDGDKKGIPAWQRKVSSYIKSKAHQGK